MLTRRSLIGGGLCIAGLGVGGPLHAQLGGKQLPIELVAGGAPKAFKMHSRIVIPSYPIRFITAAEGNGGGRVGIFLTLKGPTEAIMRKLAVDARNDLVNRLTMALKMPVASAKLLAEPSYAALPKVPGNGKWDAGTLDPMGKRYWFLTSSPDAPLLDGWGSTTGSREASLNSKMTVISRALDAVSVIPSLTLEFSTLSGSVKSGSLGSTAWVGGDILFGFKPHSWTYFMAGGKRSIEMVGGTFNPKGRVLISPTPIPGTTNNDAGDLPPEIAERLGRGRHAQFTPDMTAWTELVRMAYRGYNETLVNAILAASR